MVDDEPNILTLVQVMLTTSGIDVILAENGEIGYQKAVAEKPDLIITDVVMPGMDGISLCRLVRNTPEIADTPIIILSAMGDEYKKITGFEEGADDYITKPFNLEILKARVKSLLARYSRNDSMSDTPATAKSKEVDPIERIPTGLAKLDELTSGGFPKGSNILVLGYTGRGKSTFVRQFLAAGLKVLEKGLYVALDDDPARIRAEIAVFLDEPTRRFETENLMQFVDAYSWSALAGTSTERFSVVGALELNQLSGVISDASYALGQTVQEKMGGRRVVDSISSLLVSFDLPSVQRFLNQIARTATAFGGVTTLFVMEDGTVDDHVLNNVRYTMDGIVEFGEVDGKRAVRVPSMKWTTPLSKGWVTL